MEETELDDPGSIYQYMLKKDKSLIYIGVISTVIVLTMAYLTFFVDDVSTLFDGKTKTEVVAEEEETALDQTSEMDDAQVRKSLVKFVEAFYYDQRRGYFDPPSYFANITDTYYNYHNLTYQRLKDIHWMRMKEMRDLNLNWIVSSLEFERKEDDLVVTYWTKINYFKPSKNARESADVKNEMIINENGKIISLRELEVKNFNSFVVSVPDSLEIAPIDEAEITLPEVEETDQAPVSGREVKPEAKTETANANKVYDLATVESAPEFRGGSRRLTRYLKNNLNYPKQAKQNKVEGTVYVSFIVEKNGSLSGLYIIRGIGSGCDEEAMRVVRNSPSWKPGTIDGKPVRTSFTVPVQFKL
ncbi:MAG TPA: energy transducer TonB [Sphingobacteriaceae bacterium]